ncbi:conjugal transfer nickase/helicase domain-containing protein [Legionella dresdenensis]|uniref:Conjugal transfer nickase/helicase domain-containing protein n=1 Tax=Legionella dresdenensis TaxID=450200 RepID=A0ABV8CEH4_9GAMM
MFHRMGKKGVTVHAKPLKDLTRMSTAEHLLADEKRTTLMQQIREECKLENARFESLCQVLVHNLVNYCQQLPDSSHSYYSEPCGLLDYALNRTEAALGLFKKFVITDESNEFSEDQKLWQYALLSAAILQGAGKLFVDYTVELYDNNGQFLKQWNPLLENMILTGSHYSYSFQKEGEMTFRQRLNIVFAKMLMPASGFSWIASKPLVLQTWLALLNEDYYSAGTLGAILIRADAIAIQRYLNQLALKKNAFKGGRFGRAGTFTGTTPEAVRELEQHIGVEFIHWLTNALESGLIMVNKAPLLMVPGGLLMLPDMFKLFVRSHPEYKNWQAVQSGFLSLRLHSLSADGDIHSSFEQNNNQRVVKGIVVRHYGVVLPNQVQVHNINTGQTETASAVEVIQQAPYNNHFTRQQHMTPVPLLAINQAGIWQEQAVSQPAPAQHKGVTHGA